MKYRVGDVVRVRKDLNISKDDYHMDDDGSSVCIVFKMLEFAGKYVTIKRAIDTLDYADAWARGYMIEEAEEAFIWTDEMFGDECIFCALEDIDKEEFSVLYDWL